MRISHIAIKNLWHRKLSTLIILLGITLCVALVVALQRVSQGAIDEIRKAMLEMRQNLVVLPPGVSLDQYWAADFGDNTLPEDDFRALANYCMHEHKPKLLARHFLGSLQREIRIDGKSVILSGITVEIDVEAPKSVTAGAQRPLAPGEAELGSRAAARLGLGKGGTLKINAPLEVKTFTVVRVRKETGTVDDYKVFVDLGVAQEILGVGKVVNVIEAVSCECSPQFLPVLAKRIEDKIFGSDKGKPRGRVYHFMAIVEARRAAREAVMENANLMSAIAVGFGALVVAAYSVWSARDGRRETGLLLAIAMRPRQVAWLCVIKMLFLGVVGGAVGCWLGYTVVTLVESGGFNPNHPALRHYVLSVPMWQLYGLAVVGAALLAVVPALVGAAVALRTDPANTLREI